MEYHVVMVDDDSLSLTNARTLLDGEDIRVSCLRSGKDLLKFLAKETPDLILLDILMPEMDGFETFHRVRAFQEETGKPAVPVIFLTGENGVEIERRSFRTGGSDFIRKPFNKDTLVNRIKNTIINNRTIETLTEEATVDKLTGFLNKGSGTKKIAEICKERTGALAVCDLDSFKLVNDLYGHDMGDKMLRALAEVIRHNTREKDIVSRIGGDEFMAFFDNLTEEKALSALCDRLNAQVLAEAARLMGEDYGIPLGISMGVVMVPEYGRDFEVLFPLADSALYSVKESGKHSYAIYGLREVDLDVVSGNLDSELERVLKTVEERNEGRGPMVLGREAFAAAYRYALRICKSHSQAATLMLFDIVCPEGYKGPDSCEVSAGFSEILQQTLDRCDIILQNRQNQFLVFIPEAGGDEAEQASEKIAAAWNNTSYSGNSKIEFAFKKLL